MKIYIEYQDMPKELKEPMISKAMINGTKYILESISWGGDPPYIEVWEVEDAVYYRNRSDF